ncbi:MAG: GGDEF domain-containing protein [Candidatus Thiodiazotropha endolucinida]
MTTEANRNLHGTVALVHADKIRLLFKQSFPAVFVSISVSALLAAALWPVQDHTLLLAWFSVLSVSSLLRVGMFMAYRRKVPTQEEVLAWEKPYFTTLMLSSLIWGIGCVVIMPPESLFHQALVFYCLIGMSGGAIAVYSAHRLVTLLTVACVLLPATLWIFWQATLPTTVMAIGALFFYAALIQGTKVLSSAMHQNLVMNYELQEANAYVERLARTDKLTGLLNRRAFYDQAGMLVNYVERHDGFLAAIVFDLDHFKSINDKRGHAAGDAALAHVGELLKRTTRKSDICARIGGEEFVILLSGSTGDAAVALAEKLRSELASRPVSFSDEQFVVTGSFGVASGDTEVDELIKRADAAMYRAKQAGRNRVAAD